MTNDVYHRASQDSHPIWVKCNLNLGSKGKERGTANSANPTLHETANYAYACRFPTEVLQDGRGECGLIIGRLFREWGCPVTQGGRLQESSVEMSLQGSSYPGCKLPPIYPCFELQLPATF